MTKLDIIHYILSYDIKPIHERLKKLYEEDRITVGAYFYVYNPFNSYYLKQVSELVGKACKSKDYFRYIKRTDHLTLTLWKRGFDEDLAKALAFLEEQESLPFEQSQKQQLILKGELQ